MFAGKSPRKRSALPNRPRHLPLPRLRRPNRLSEPIANLQTAESATATIRVRVRMVQVDAVVRDRAGRMIDNLTADDFRVYEDGVLQEMQSFSRDELPLAVALVIDRSGSVGPYISELRRIATPGPESTQTPG